MKRLGAALGLTALGAVTTLTGLAWDAYLHARDPNLVHTESLFTLSNPGHLLLITGVAVTVAGIAAALLLLPIAKVARFTAVGLVGAIALSSAGVLAWAAQTETQQQAAAAKPAAKDQLVQGGGASGTAASGIVTHVHGTTDPSQATAAEKAAAQLLLERDEIGGTPEHVIAEREIEVERRPLVVQRNASAFREHELAAVQVGLPREDPEQRRLAGPVRTDHAVDRQRR
jgi:hypothetical protein